jgi:cob(I)alamin adenosyltransferase
MGFRLSKIYTKTGDKGTSSLADGTILNKDDDIFECIGNIDELNSLIGCVISALPHQSSTLEILIHIQHQLFNYGAELAMPKYKKISNSDICFLEDTIDTINLTLPALKEFILPGGTIPAANCFLARAYARRTERSIVKIKSQKEYQSPYLLQYINRLSDLLFVLSRLINKEQGAQETYWHSQRLQKKL